MSYIVQDGFEFAFDPTACMRCEGNCCRGESGYIWVDESEIEQIANFLTITKERFKKDYLKKINGRYSIKEICQNGEYLCIFFHKGCEIYSVRPKQCRTYPFWEEFKKNKEEVWRECKGILPLP